MQKKCLSHTPTTFDKTILSIHATHVGAEEAMAAAAEVYDIENGDDGYFKESEDTNTFAERITIERECVEA